MDDTLIFRPDEWPHGLRCTDCDHPFQDGEHYSMRLDQLTADGTPIVEITCVPCGMSLPV